MEAYLDSSCSSAWVTGLCISELSTPGAPQALRACVFEYSYTCVCVCWVRMCAFCVYVCTSVCSCG